MRLKATIIICTRNRTTDLLRCLRTIKQQTVSPYEIIVVDSSTQPLIALAEFTQLFCDMNFKNSSLRYMHTAQGLTYQRNQGIAIASGDVYHFLDDDVTLTPTYLHEMQRVFEQYPHYVGGMGTVTNMDGYRFTLMRLLRIVFLLPRDYASGLFTFSGMPTHAYGTLKIKQVQVLGGCCMAYRSWVFFSEKFDEKLRLYGYMEDCDLSARIAQNYALFFNPHAQLEHHNSPLNRDKIVDNKAMFIANYSYLFFKNFYSYNRLRVVAYAWSIAGLFFEAFLLRDRLTLQGYFKGMRFVWMSRARDPFGAI